MTHHLRLPHQLKCYLCRLNTDTEVVGVCMNCGRCVCYAHSTMIDGRLYCDGDADSASSSRARSWTGENERSATIPIASVCLVIYGVAGFIFSTIVLLAAYVGATATSILQSAYSFGLDSVGLYALGLSTFVVASFGTTGGYMMWKSQKNGGFVSVFSLLAGVVIASTLYGTLFSLPALEFCLAFSGINLGLIVLIALGWESLYSD